MERKAVSDFLKEAALGEYVFWYAPIQIHLNEIETSIVAQASAAHIYFRKFQNMNCFSDDHAEQTAQI